MSTTIYSVSEILPLSYKYPNTFDSSVSKSFWIFVQYSTILRVHCNYIVCSGSELNSYSFGIKGLSVNMNSKIKTRQLNKLKNNWKSLRGKGIKSMCFVPQSWMMHFVIIYSRVPPLWHESEKRNYSPIKQHWENKCLKSFSHSVTWILTKCNYLWLKALPNLLFQCSSSHILRPEMKQQNY